VEALYFAQPSNREAPQDAPLAPAVRTNSTHKTKTLVPATEEQLQWAMELVSAARALVTKFGAKHPLSADEPVKEWLEHFATILKIFWNAYGGDRAAEPANWKACCELRKQIEPLVKDLKKRMLRQLTVPENTQEAFIARLQHSEFLTPSDVYAASLRSESTFQRRKIVGLLESYREDTAKMKLARAAITAIKTVAALISAKTGRRLHFTTARRGTWVKREGGKVFSIMSCAVSAAAKKRFLFTWASTGGVDLSNETLLAWFTELFPSGALHLATHEYLKMLTEGFCVGEIDGSSTAIRAFTSQAALGLPLSLTSPANMPMFHENAKDALEAFHGFFLFQFQAPLLY
jgi:hypothetical protein